MTNNPNTLGVTMILGVFSIAYFAGTNYKKTIISFVIACWMLYTVVNCGSRKSLIAVVLIMALWAFSLYSETMRNGQIGAKIGIIAIIVGLIAVIAYYYLHYYQGTDMA